MASFAALATRNFTTFFAAILIAAPVAGFRPNNSDIGLHEGATSCFWRVPSGADTAPRYSHLLVGGRPSYFFPPWRKGPRSAAEWSAPLETKFLLFETRQEQDSVLLRPAARRSPSCFSGAGLVGGTTTARSGPNHHEHRRARLARHALSLLPRQDGSEAARPRRDRRASEYSR